ncbi:MAG TPA: NfeD family protein [Gammaproteobacteria bacterium]|nr:NfeD family protein [Gammaproteobacteria bacterium]
MFEFGIVLLVAGALIVAAEIHSFTIYLVAVAIACFVAGSLAFWVHTSLPATMIAFALVLIAGLPAAHYARRLLSNSESDRISHDDVGARVEVVTARRGTIRVAYRGAEWDARPIVGLPMDRIRPGVLLRVAGRDGNILIVEEGDDVAPTGT